jgi:hypothetical protein
MMEFKVQVEYRHGMEVLTVRARSAAHMLQEAGKLLARKDWRARGAHRSPLDGSSPRPDSGSATRPSYSQSLR